MKTQQDPGAAGSAAAPPDRPAHRRRDRRAAQPCDPRSRLAPSCEGRGREDPGPLLSQQILGRLDALGLSERQASLQAGLSPDCVKEIVAGRRRPRPSTLNRLGRVLGCDLRG